ncbi:MAG: hypothetical protein J7L11_09845 [Thermoprotei archaeon]|nr:hypothetical protein [Thermoprotei archaeon]
MPKQAKRTFYDIYANILAFLARRGAGRITQIARYSNLPVDRAKRVLNDMVVADLVRRRREEESTTYAITPRGYEYLELYRRLRKLIAPSIIEERPGWLIED